MVEHRDLTGVSLHETIGVDSATAGSVHTAVGDGSSTWSLLTSANIDTSSIFGTNKIKLLTHIDDISTASFILIPISNSCSLTRATTVLHNAITTADAILTFTNSNGPSVMGTLTIAQSGSAEGDVDAFTPVGSTAFTMGTYLKIATNGASDTAARLSILLDFTLTGA